MSSQKDSTSLQENKKTSWTSVLKNIFFIFLIIQIAPSIFGSLKHYFTDAVHPKTDVGFIRFHGVISDSAMYVKQIEKFNKASDIKAILLKLDSPGGTSGSTQSIFNELKKIKGQKPIIALIEDACTSGAYYIAVASDHIIACPSSLIGSVGVIMGFQGMPLPNFKERMDEWKISFEFIQAGKYKSAGNFFKQNTPEEIAHLQSVVDDTYKQFVKDIADARKLSVDDHKTWADGKIFTGNQALELKLIDQIGSIQDAIDEIKKRANITTDIRFVYPEKQSGLFSWFQGDEGYQNETMGQFGVAQGLFSMIAKFFGLRSEKQGTVSLMV